MDYQKFAKKYAAEINGDFSEYDDQQSVIIVPLSGNRFQAVQGRAYTHEPTKRMRVEVKSTVCKADEKIDFKSLLTKSAEYVHSKFIIEDGFLRVEASAFIDNAPEAQVKEMIQEVGHLADLWEKNITGKDIF
jgi:CRISPR/Cas system-associated endoribonuclease Cas2